MTVANFKKILFDQKEIKEAKITKINIWKVELESCEVNNLSTEDIINHEKSEKMELMLNFNNQTQYPSLFCSVITLHIPVLPGRWDSSMLKATLNSSNFPCI